MSLEAYSKYRKEHKPFIIAHRKLRSVQLGEHINLQFESETTIRYQIQEMLRIEKIFEEEGIQQELEAYVPLMPEGSNWKATMLLEYPDVNERKRELARLIDAGSFVNVEEVDEDALGRFRTQVEVHRVAGHSAELRFEHEVELLDLAPVAVVLWVRSGRWKEPP